MSELHARLNVGANEPSLCELFKCEWSLFWLTDKWYEFGSAESLATSQKAKPAHIHMVCDLPERRRTHYEYPCTSPFMTPYWVVGIETRQLLYYMGLSAREVVKIKLGKVGSCPGKE
eukprot:6208860-Pleurochrysis_carterae.AAC.6